MRPLLLLLALPVAAVAQDMPLFTFSNPADGWVMADGKRPAPPEKETTDRKGWHFETTFPLGDRKFTVEHFNEGPLKPDVPPGKKFDFFELKRPQSRTATAFARTADGGTVYVAFDKELAVWAYTPGKGGVLENGAPYAPLRTRTGYDNSKAAREEVRYDPPKLYVTALALDPAGRLFAATGVDVQVFDPTGRPCGSLALPERKLTADAMAWEGKDALAVWVGEQKWVRRMRAE